LIRLGAYPGALIISVPSYRHFFFHALSYVKPDVAEVATPARVLSLCRAMIAMELSCEPRIRARMRQIYEGSSSSSSSSSLSGSSSSRDRRGGSGSGATLSTAPTAQGTSELDLFHRFHGLQHLRQKPALLVVEEAEAAAWSSEAGGEDTEAALEGAPRSAAAEAAASSDQSGEHNSNDVRCMAGHAQQRQTLWLRLQQAKRAGLVTYTLDPPKSALPGADLDPYGHFRAPFENAGALVASSSSSSSRSKKDSENGDGDAKDSDDELEASCRADVVDAWNGERLQVLDDAIAHRLIPALKSGLEKKLRDSSRQAVVYGASAKLRSQYLTLGPFVPMSVRQNNPAEALTSRAGAGGARVVGVCVSDDKRFGDALVALTEQGAVNILFFLMLAGRIEREVFLRRNSPCTFLFKYSKLCTHTF